MKLKKILIVIATALLVSACGTTSTVPITGRKHTLLVDDATVLGLSQQQYAQALQKAKLSTNATNTAMVKRVGQKLANAVETYLRNNNYQNELQYYAWEFNLIQNKEVNAYCMPGGKIVVYEGLLPVTRDEASLAIILGHEIAHAVAKHSAEQMSKEMRQQYGTQIVGGILNSTVGGNVGNLAGALAQQGFNFANLKYSRDNESEADYLGLIFAAMAGYNPEVAIPLWERMSSMSSASRSEFLSDHPSDATRLANFKKNMPTALKYYNPPTVTTSSAKATTSKTTTKKK